MLLAGCDGGGAVIGVARPDSPPDVGDTAIDVGDTANEPGAVEIAYTWENELMPVSSCAEAGMTTLTVTVDGGSAVDFPCNDAPIRRYDVPVGSHTLEVSGDTAYGVSWRSGEVEVEVDASGDLTPVDAVLLCHEGNVDDGCGGA